MPDMNIIPYSTTQFNQALRYFALFLQISSYEMIHPTYVKILIKKGGSILEPPLLNGNLLDIFLIRYIICRYIFNLG
jgi:hypothetical protein